MTKTTLNFASGSFDFDTDFNLLSVYSDIHDSNIMYLDKKDILLLKSFLDEILTIEVK